MGQIAIRRRFADVPFGQMHYRTAGEGAGPAVLVCHASPGSSRQLEPLIRALAERGLRVIAPDTPGNGDSTPLELASPQIGDYAQAMLAFLDAIGEERVDAYGSHTGAGIAVELALLSPERIRRLVQDGVAAFSEAERERHLANYARPFTPDLDGAYLLQAFMFCRDQFLFFPWYERNRAHRREGGLAPAADLHAWLVEVLKAAETYPLGYRAAFRYPAAERLPLVQHPVLCVAAEDDPLREATVAAAHTLRDGRFHALPRFDSGYVDALAEAMQGFLTA
jgi:pimeloyl-ACP methyl ester carboxylesterase